MYFVIIEATETAHRVLYAGRPSPALVAAIALSGFKVNERHSASDRGRIGEIVQHRNDQTTQQDEEYKALRRAWVAASADHSISLNFGPAIEQETTPS